MTQVLYTTKGILNTVCFYYEDTLTLTVEYIGISIPRQGKHKRVSLTSYNSGGSTERRDRDAIEGMAG